MTEGDCATRRVSIGEGCFRVELTVVETFGRGACAMLVGGDSPHVGGVAVALPRAKTNRAGITCDISQICLPGHKDVHAASKVADILAKGINEPVSVTAGIHMDGADEEDIAQLLDNAKSCAETWLRQHRLV